MSVIILPRRGFACPIGHLRLKRQHPLAVGLVYSARLGIDSAPVNLVTRVPGTGAFGGFKSNPTGPALETLNTGTAHHVGSQLGLAAPSALSIALEINCYQSLSSSPPCFAGTSTFGPNCGWHFGGHWTGAVSALDFTFAGVAAYNSAADANFFTVANRIGCAVTANSTIRFFAGGAFLDAVAVGACITNSSNVYLGGLAVYGFLGFAYYSYMHIWSRAISDVEQQQIAAAPFDMWEDARDRPHRRYMVPVAAGPQVGARFQMLGVQTFGGRLAA